MSTAREALAEVIWSASRADEGTISATGANVVADAVLASPAMARLLAEVRAEALREAAVALALRRLGMTFSDPWREGWNRALEVIRDDLRTNAHPTDDHAGEAK